MQGPFEQRCQIKEAATPCHPTQASFRRPVRRPQGCISIHFLPRSPNPPARGDFEKFGPVHLLSPSPDRQISPASSISCFAYRAARRATRSACSPRHERRRPRPAYARQRRGRPVQRNRVHRGPRLLQRYRAASHPARGRHHCAFIGRR